MAQLSDHLMRALPEWSLAPVVDSAIALRGIDKLAAIILLAGLGDISRFDSPKQLMGFLGLVPSGTPRGLAGAGGITLTGNGRARRMLVESAWSYRFPARQTMHLKRKALNASEAAKKIAWAAQKRLCGRYRTLTRAGKNASWCSWPSPESRGYIWDIVRQETERVATQAGEARSPARRATIDQAVGNRDRHIDSGHTRPVWRILVRAIPAACGRIPQRASRRHSRPRVKVGQ